MLRKTIVTWAPAVLLFAAACASTTRPEPEARQMTEDIRDDADVRAHGAEGR